MIQILRLKKRQDFLRLTRLNIKWVSPAFVLQIAPTPTEDLSSSCVRLGFTASRKVGNAVKRNRCKRRLRALSSLLLPLYGKSDHDYVLIARAGCLTKNFEQMKEDLSEALQKISRKLDKRS
ncbi:MAG: ribonuclease P protein component [bacterium]|nr:ribonuclease P protein component [bacterium]